MHLEDIDPKAADYFRAISEQQTLIRYFSGEQHVVDANLHQVSAYIYAKGKEAKAV